MPVLKGLGWTFDTVASTYEKMRPGYVAELYKDLLEYQPLDASSRAVEVGIGGGQATEPVLKTGCSVTAVEPGENFVALCRDKFRDYPRFSVVNGRFEDVDFVGGSVDLVYSASAFHWVPEEIGYKKVFQMLKSGGTFARFANHPHPDKGRPELSEDIQRLYAEYYASFHGRNPAEAPKPYTQEQAQQRAEIAEKYGFTDIRFEMYHRIRSFTADEYVQLLGTYSDHIAICEEIRRPFFDGIRQAIRKYGGVISIYDTIDLQMARKP